MNHAEQERCKAIAEEADVRTERIWQEKSRSVAMESVVVAKINGSDHKLRAAVAVNLDVVYGRELANYAKVERWTGQEWAYLTSIPVKQTPTGCQDPSKSKPQAMEYALRLTRLMLVQEAAMILWGI